MAVDLWRKLALASIGGLEDGPGEYVALADQQPAGRTADESAEGAIGPVVSRRPQPGIGDHDLPDCLRVAYGIRQSDRPTAVTDDQRDDYEFEGFQ